MVEEGGARKLHLDLEYVSAIPAAYRYDSGKLMSLSGINLGNLAFRHALPLIVAEFDDYWQVNYRQFLDVAEPGTVDSVLVSCANWLGTREEDEMKNAKRALCFEKTDAAIVSFGLGVQAGSGTTTVKLGPETVRMAKIMSERAPKLSVRDQITQDTLEAAGILNTVVTGCPSNFINGDDTLGSKTAARARWLMRNVDSWSDVRTLISEAFGGHSSSGDVVRAQMELMAQSPSFYVVQTPAMLAFVLNEDDVIHPLYSENDPFADAARLRQLLRAKMLHFSSVDAWMDFARTCDLSFGMRIHGSMIPLQAGVPSALITHDSRTSGLADRMGIPTLSPEGYLQLQAGGPAEMCDLIAGVMDGYDTRRTALANVMHDFVTSNGLTPGASLRQLL